MSDRLIGVFGKREPELAAIKIIDAGITLGWIPIARLNLSEYETDGVSMLIYSGLVDVRGRGPNTEIKPTGAFWTKVKGKR